MGSKKVSTTIENNTSAGLQITSSPNTFADLQVTSSPKTSQPFIGYNQPVTNDFGYTGSWISEYAKSLSEVKSGLTKEEAFEMQKAIFDSNIPDDMKIKIISYLGKDFY